MKLHDGISWGFHLCGCEAATEKVGKIGLSNGEGSSLMQNFTNGMAAHLIQGTWVKSRRSEANGMCVELAALPRGGVAVRNSTDPAGPALIFTAEEMDAFLDGAKRGEFDAFGSPN
ncbi:DUF397 domain-containing protein [Streptomyces sp. NPDC050538]|uniref:DUF397 domain-containing protein n=1 Tax=Streptomyces sp. NPDC050538 TaxID=3365627 RepID=UPI003797A599